MAIFVLVHGGGHGGWCYDRLAARLRAEGHEVHAPTLTGVGERLHEVTPAVGLETHIADIVGLLEAKDLRDVVLVGHSYGGPVITGVADRAGERIARLVYLDAVRPRSGESLADVVGDQAVAPAREAMRVVDGVELVLWPEQAGPHYGVTDPDDFEWLMSKVTPHPWKSFTDKLILADEEAVRRIPRTAINCTPSLRVRDDAGRARMLDADQVFEIDTGHDLMITEPGAVAEILLRLV